MPYKDKTKQRESEIKYKNSEKGKQTQKNWSAKNKGLRKKYNKRYYKANLEKINKKKREWNAKNREKLNRLSRERDRRIRREVIKHYGGKCKCCNEKQYEFLAIDHINGNGNKHRREVGAKIHLWLHKNGMIKGFQVLCHNCNMAKGFYGKCPHQS